MSKLKSLLGKQFLFLDGGTGSVLQSRGLKPGELSESWNITHPEEIVNLHYSYYMAGSNIVCTNTFGAYDSKIENTEEIVSGMKIVLRLFDNAEGVFAVESDNRDCIKLFKRI